MWVLAMLRYPIGENEEVAIDCLAARSWILNSINEDKRYPMVGVDLVKHSNNILLSDGVQ